MNDFKGVIIEESLRSKETLKSIQILSTKVEEVTPEHKTPWLIKWTLHTVEIPQERIDRIPNELKDSLEKNHPWYIHLWNESELVVLYHNKIFKFTHNDKEKRVKAIRYGVSLGIPEYQLDFPVTQ